MIDSLGKSEDWFTEIILCRYDFPIFRTISIYLSELTDIHAWLSARNPWYKPWVTLKCSMRHYGSVCHQFNTQYQIVNKKGVGWVTLISKGHDSTPGRPSHATVASSRSNIKMSDGAKLIRDNVLYLTFMNYSAKKVIEWKETLLFILKLYMRISYSTSNSLSKYISMNILFNLILA